MSYVWSYETSLCYEAPNYIRENYSYTKHVHTKTPRRKTTDLGDIERYSYVGEVRRYINSSQTLIITPHRTLFGRRCSTTSYTVQTGCFKVRVR